MNHSELLSKMVAPGTPRRGKYLNGVIQIWVTRACDLSCYNCTQGSNLSGKPEMISLENFEIACKSLKGYWGVVGVFGGNPALHPQFSTLCKIMKEHIPQRQRGIWSNNPINEHKTRMMRDTFNPRYSNLNVHLNRSAYDMFKEYWPECSPVGLEQDSRHSPVYVAMKDVIENEEERNRLISNCDINKHWSAMIGQFRGEARAWFCEVAGAQAMLHQDDKDYPDTGLPLGPHYRYHVHGVYNEWWQLPMDAFKHQVHKHCHECSVPLRGYGALAQGQNQIEQTSRTHEKIYNSKKKDRVVQVVTDRLELGMDRLQKFTHYLQNSKV